jgi:hypothetical protein
MSNLRSVPARLPRARLLWRLALILALLALVALALGGSIGSLQHGVLMLAPALALAVLMLTRPYLGEHTIARLRARGARRRDATPVTLEPGRSCARLARGGCLIALALAGRAPPPALAGSH